MKKLISLLVAITLTFSSFCVFAQGSVDSIKLTRSQQKKVSLLYAMNIIENLGEEETSMTRGEFAYSLAKLGGLDENWFSTENKFSDVPATHKYAKAINAVSSVGCMNGIAADQFGVNQTISYTNALVAMVRFLGYEEQAIKKGGYPDGYIAWATKLGLNKDGYTENERINIALMFYNALSVPVVNSSENTYVVSSLLDMHDVYEFKGIVNGNRFTCVGRENSGLKVNEIKIGNEIYVTEEVQYAEYIGQYVEGHYFYDRSNDEKHIISLNVVENLQKQITIKAEDIISAGNNTLKYTDEKDRTQTAKLRAGFDYIVNGCTDNSRTTADLKLKDGELTLIDSNRDGSYDLVIAKSVETFTYTGVDLTEDLIYCKEGILYTDPFDETYYAEVILVDEETMEETPISIDEIPSDSVLTVYRSKDEKYLKVFAISSTVSGVLEVLGSEDITIDGIEYDHPLKTPVSDLPLGKKVTFSVDIFGRLVSLVAESSYQGPDYGYFFDYAVNRRKGEILIITGDEYVILNCAEKVTVDDKDKYSGHSLHECSALFDGEESKRQLIRYTLNSEGEVRKIYTASGNAKYSLKKQSDINKDTEINYFQWHRIFEKKYILPQENFFLVVPDYEDEASNEELYGTKYNFGDDVSSLYAEVYDVDENMEAGAVLVYNKEPLEGLATTTANSDVGVFIDGAMCEDGPIAEIYTNGEKRTFIVDSANYDSLRDFSFGDVVRYVVAKDGRISTLYTVLDIGTTGENTPVPTVTEDGWDFHYFGRVQTCLEDYMVIIPNQNNADFDDSLANRVIVPNDYQTCLFVDMKNESVLTGTFDNVVPYFEDDGRGGCYVYARMYKWATAKELIIYKF